MKRDLLKTDVPLLVLSVLAQGTYHSYGITREIERLSDDRLTVRQNTLTSLLRTLELDGVIVGIWTVQKTGPPRKMYSLTEKGRLEQIKQREQWRLYTRMIEEMVSGR